MVFNCDESLDVKSISRTFYGIASAGAWGCFDEFNRLSVAQLSAISSVIRDIQKGLKQLMVDSQGGPHKTPVV